MLTVACDGLLLAGLEADAGEGLELLGGPLDRGARTGHVELNHLVGVHAALVGQHEGDLDGVLVSGSAHLAIAEVHIGEAVAEGVHRFDIFGVEPAVAHERALGVLGHRLGQRVDEGLALLGAHLQDVLAVHQGEEVAALRLVGEIAQREGRGILELRREGERQLAGRGDVAEQDFGQRGAALGAVPPALDDGRADGLELTQVGGTAGNQHGHEVLIGRVEGLDDLVLADGQVDVGAVAAFGLDALVSAAEEDDDVSLLGELDGLGEQLLVGRLIDGVRLQRVLDSRGGTPATAREVLVAGCVEHFHARTGTLPDTLERGDLVEGLHTGAHAAGLRFQDGVLADDGDLLDAAGERQDAAFVLQEDDGLLGHRLGNLLALGLGGHLRIGDVVRNGFDGVADAQDLLDLVVHHLLGQGAGSDGVDDRLAEVIVTRHLDVQAMEHGAHRAVGAAPVGNGEALEAPLAAEDLVQQVLVALVHLGVDAAAVGLLVIHGEVLDTHGRTLILDTLGVAQGESGAEDRILAQVLVSAAADRQALDVHGRAEDNILAAQAGLDTHTLSVLVCQVLGPGGREGGARREIGGGVKLPARGLEAVGHALFADAEGAVGIVHVGDAEALDTGGGHVRLAVKHVDLLLQGHLGNDLVDLLVIDRQEVLGARGRLSASGNEGCRREQVKDFLVHIGLVN